jgi:hypothetical protein
MRKMPIGKKRTRLSQRRYGSFGKSYRAPGHRHPQRLDDGVHHRYPLRYTNGMRSWGKHLQQHPEIRRLFVARQPGSISENSPARGANNSHGRVFSRTPYSVTR